jgi:hypothetical protein
MSLVIDLVALPPLNWAHGITQITQSPIAFAPAFIGAVVAIPAAVYLSHLADHAGDNKGTGAQQGGTMTTNRGDVTISVVPEANPAIVLLPFIGAVLVFSSRHLFGAKAAPKTIDN